MRSRHDSSNSNTEAGTPELDSNVKRVWALLGAMFANRWPNHAGERPESARATIWRVELQSLQSHEIDRALMACRVLSARPDRWAPTPAEFRLMAQGVPTWEQCVLDVRQHGFTSRFSALVWRLLGPSANGEHRSHDRRTEYRNSDGARREQILRAGYNLAVEQIAAFGWPAEQDTGEPKSPDARSDNEHPAPRASRQGRIGEKGYAEAIKMLRERLPHCVREFDDQ